MVASQTKILHFSMIAFRSFISSSFSFTLITVNLLTVTRTPNQLAPERPSIALVSRSIPWEPPLTEGHMGQAPTSQSANATLSQNEKLDSECPFEFVALMVATPITLVGTRRHAARSGIPVRLAVSRLRISTMRRHGLDNSRAFFRTVLDLATMFQRLHVISDGFSAANSAAVINDLIRSFLKFNLSSFTYSEVTWMWV
jgi:hypothetical protein